MNNPILQSSPNGNTIVPSVKEFIDWLVVWLVSLFVDWLVGQLIQWIVHWFPSWIVSRIMVKNKMLSFSLHRKQDEKWDKEEPIKFRC